MKLSDIFIRDPFVLPVAETQSYYLFGSTDIDPWNGPGVGFDCYRSRDLVEWEGPIPAFRPPTDFWATRNFWAPEVHAYQGRYFMFASFLADRPYRGTQILMSDRPEGPFQPWSDGPVTPPHWQCLDGTLHVDDAGDPWIVFCHEWTQIRNGSICAMRLTRDLRAAAGRPVYLFSATDAPWVRPIKSEGEFPAYVTDGPFLHRTSAGSLLMLWSSFGDHGYAMGIARSLNGAIDGEWMHEPEPIWGKDGGHGMIFRAFDGRLFLTLHQPNDTPNERPHFFRLTDNGDTVRV